MRQGKAVKGGSDSHGMMHTLAQEAMKITAELNGSYHEPEEVRRLFSKLTGKYAEESFSMFPQSV